MSFTSSRTNQEFSAWQNDGVLANPAHEMRTNTRNNFSSKLPFAGAILCGIFLAMVVTVNAGPQRWSSKDKNVAVAPEEPFDWTGFYFGGHVGGVWNNYGFGDFDTAVDITQQFFGVPDFNGPGTDEFVIFHSPSDDPVDDSVIGGGQAGYNFQFGHFVVGVEADFSGVDTGRTSQYGDNFAFQFFEDGPQQRPGGGIIADGFSTDLTTNRLAETNWQGSGRLRLGYAQGPVLFYVTGGAAFAGVDVKEVDRAVTTFVEFTGFPGEAPAPIIPPGFSPVLRVRNINRDHDDDVLFGWTGGGGIEWAPHNNYSIAIEYRHNDFGDENFGFSGHRGPIFPLNHTNISVDGDQVTLRVNILLEHIWRTSH
jgi:outer membrane immunogenic protein